ncbi:leucine-rich repeat domain-containing protein [Schlesneria paludicola]|uniref:leucine-rich repeat domain-containing protein n=1 Tax=Schlesneria paludicola TaxID=360056 RepID=UPI00029AA493|nr:hypothetical protein [Schlesneria paludicola]
MDEVSRRPANTRRFLRSYLGWIVLTLMLIAVIQSYILWAFVSSFQDERRIAAKIESLGGRVEFRFTGPMWVPKSIRSHGGVTSISLTTTDRPLPAELLSEIGTLKELKTLWLLGPQVTDVAVEKLVGMKNLTGLYLGYSQLSDRGIEHLKGLSGLEWIFLIQTQVGDKTCDILQGLPNLKSIALNDTNVTDAGVKKLKALGDLQYLGLAGTDVSDDGLKYLIEMKALKRLDIGNTLISDEGQAAIRKGMTSCTIDAGSVSKRKSAGQ